MNILHIYNRLSRHFLKKKQKNKQTQKKTQKAFNGLL